MTNANNIVKPMLAAPLKEDLLHLSLPGMVQPKLDGIRAILKDGKALSRSLKPIPNKYIQECFSELSIFMEGVGFDGELIIGSPTDSDVYNRTQSGVMSQEGKPDFTYFVFDLWDDPDCGALERSVRLHKLLLSIPPTKFSWIEFVGNSAVFCIKDLKAYEYDYINKGYEGIIYRGDDKGYKFGRSTSRQGHLLKRKVWLDMEATIVGFQELMSNQNEARISERGYTVRSSMKDGLVAAGTLGAFNCECIYNDKPGVKIDIGTGLGLDQKLRQQVWDNRETYLGKIIKFKYLPIGSKNAPRHPIFLGFRDPIDL